MSAIAKAIETDVLALGYEAEVKISRELSDVTFLSGLFFPVAGRLYWAPKPGKLIASMGWVVNKPPNYRRWMQELAGNLNSFLPYRFVPFLRLYLEHVMQLVPEEYRLYKSDEFRSVVAGKDLPSEPTADTWAFVYARYGLRAEDEQEFGKAVRLANTLPFMIESRSFATLVDVDVYG